MPRGPFIVGRVHHLAELEAASHSDLAVAMDEGPRSCDCHPRPSLPVAQTLSPLLFRTCHLLDAQRTQSTIPMPRPGLQDPAHFSPHLEPHNSELQVHEKVLPPLQRTKPASYPRAFAYAGPFIKNPSRSHAAGPLSWCRGLSAHKPRPPQTRQVRPRSVLLSVATIFSFTALLMAFRYLSLLSSGLTPFVPCSSASALSAGTSLFCRPLHL